MKLFALVIALILIVLSAAAWFCTSTILSMALGIRNFFRKPMPLHKRFMLSAGMAGFLTVGTFVTLHFFDAFDLFGSSAWIHAHDKMLAVVIIVGLAVPLSFLAQWGTSTKPKKEKP